MLNLKEFAIPFGLLCLALWVWLFATRPIYLLAGFFLTAVVVVVLYKNEDIVQLVFEPRRVLIQMRDIQEEIFAKAEEVRRLAEQMGELAAFNISQMWSLAPEDSEIVIFEKRNQLVAALKDMKIEANRIKAIAEPLDTLIRWNLATRVWQAIPKEARSAGTAQERELFGQQLTEALVKSEPGEAQRIAKALLQPKGAWSENVEAEVTRFDRFRKTGELQKRELPNSG